MSIFIDLEMNTTDARLVHKKDLRNEIIEIYAWSTSDLCQLRKECGFKGIDSVFLDEMVQWHDFQEDFRQMLGEKSILSLSNAMRRAGLEPEGCLHDASWDAYNSARLMETAYSPNFAADAEKAQAACYQEAPRMQGGLPLDVMMKLAALLQPEPCAVV